MSNQFAASIIDEEGNQAAEYTRQVEDKQRQAQMKTPQEEMKLIAEDLFKSGMKYASLEVTKPKEEIINEALKRLSQLMVEATEQHFQTIVPDEGPPEDTKGSFADGYAKAVEDICKLHFKQGQDS